MSKSERKLSYIYIHNKTMVIDAMFEGFTGSEGFSDFHVSNF